MNNERVYIYIYSIYSNSTLPYLTKSRKHPEISPPLSFLQSPTIICTSSNTGITTYEDSMKNHESNVSAIHTVSIANLLSLRATHSQFGPASRPLTQRLILVEDRATYESVYRATMVRSRSGLPIDSRRAVEEGEKTRAVSR